MSHLVLELRPGEMMVVNGATIRFRSKCRVELMSQARFLFGKQIMGEHEAQTATRRLYYWIQTAYAGVVEERQLALTSATQILKHLREEEASEVVEHLDLVEQSLANADFYKALKLLRSMIMNENRQQPMMAASS